VFGKNEVDLCGDRELKGALRRGKKDKNKQIKLQKLKVEEAGRINGVEARSSCYCVWEH